MFIGIKETSERTRRGRSSIYVGINDGTFPKPVQLGARASGFVAVEVDAWIAARIAERDAA